MLKIIPVVLALQCSVYAMDPQQVKTSLSSDLVNLRNSLAAELQKLRPKFQERGADLNQLNDSIGKILDAIRINSAQPHSHDVKFINDGTVLVLWNYTIDLLINYIELCDRLILINQSLISNITHNQHPQVEQNRVAPALIPENTSDEEFFALKLNSLLPRMGEPKTILDSSGTTISALIDMVIKNKTQAGTPEAQLLDAATILTIWNFTLDRLKNYMDESEKLLELSQVLTSMQPIQITFSVAELLELKLDIWNLPGFMRKCLGGLCNFVSRGTWGKSFTQFDTDVSQQRGNHLVEIAKKIIGILKKNNSKITKDDIRNWLVSAREISSYLDIIDGYLDRAIKENPQANAQELIDLMRHLKHQDDEEERRRQESDSSSSSDNSSEEKQPQSQVKSGTDDLESLDQSQSTESSTDDHTSAGETVSRTYEGPGWTSMDERSFQSGNQFDQDVPSGREITKDSQ